jgi:hypothetical protein
MPSYWHELVASREEMNNLLHQFVDPTRKLALATAALLAQGLLQLVLVIFFVFFIFRDAHLYAPTRCISAAGRSPATSANACWRWPKARSPESWSASSAPRRRRRWWR